MQRLAHHLHLASPTINLSLLHSSLSRPLPFWWLNLQLLPPTRQQKSSQGPIRFPLLHLFNKHQFPLSSINHLLYQSLTNLCFNCIGILRALHNLQTVLGERFDGLSVDGMFRDIFQGVERCIVYSYQLLSWLGMMTDSCYTRWPFRCPEETSPMHRSTMIPSGSRNNLTWSHFSRVRALQPPDFRGCVRPMGNNLQSRLWRVWPGPIVFLGLGYCFVCWMD